MFREDFRTNEREPPLTFKRPAALPAFTLTAAHTDFGYAARDEDSVNLPQCLFHSSQWNVQQAARCPHTRDGKFTKGQLEGVQPQKTQGVTLFERPVARPYQHRRSIVTRNHPTAKRSQETAIPAATASQVQQGQTSWCTLRKIDYFLQQPGKPAILFRYITIEI